MFRFTHFFIDRPIFATVLSVLLTIAGAIALRTLPIAILMFNDKYATNYGQIFAASIIALLPVILIYIAFQKKFVQSGFNEGAVKG